MMTFQNVILPVGVSFIRLVLIFLVTESGVREYSNVFVPPQSKFYDFIVIGSGSAGAIVASRLSEEPGWDVLLLEAGGPPTPESFVPGLDILLYTSESDWGYKTARQETSMFGYEGRSNRYPRGKALGGSSATNYMMYVRGNKLDYDNWAAMGNPGWDYKTVLHYFKKSEDFRGSHSANDSYFHGNGGPLQVSKKDWGTMVGTTFLQAGKELGFQVGDPNAASQTVFSIPDLTTKNGLRHSTAEAFLRPIWGKRKNFNMLHSAHVTKILFGADRRAVGVKYIYQGEERVALSKREVILCAGSIDSPKILMLSGVGPRKHLEEHGIDVVYDLPGVGQNLIDHPVIFGLTWLVNSGTALSLGQFINPKNIFNYFLSRTGPYSVPFGVESNAWAPLEEQNPEWPDTQYLAFSATPTYDSGVLFQNLIGYQRKLFEDYFKDAFKREGFCIGPILTRPKSRGTITLQSINPFQQAKIDPKFLSHPDDLRLMVKAIHFARKVGSTQAMKSLLGARFLDTPLPGCEHHELESNDYWACYARYMTSTVYHPVGTCKMAPADDPMGVVDSRLRVRGVTGLRIIDASIMPQIPSGNTHAPSMMVGERGADFVKEDWMKNYV